MSLFRQEVFDAKRHAIYGSATLYRPFSFATLTFLMVFVVVALFIYGWFCYIPNRENVQGWVTSTHGMARIYPKRAGTISEVLVKPGELVKRGQVLAVLDTDMAGASGRLSDEQKANLTKKIRELDIQIYENGQKLNIEKRRLKDRADSANQEAASIANQLLLAREQSALQRKDIERLKDAVQQHLISQEDYNGRARQILSQEQSIIESQRLQEEKRTEARDAMFQISEADEELRRTISELRSQRISLVQTIYESESQGATRIVAPIDGIVDYSGVNIGRAVTVEMPLFSVSPSSGSPSVELIVPSSAAGFIKPGQSVQLKIDAYSYERYGSVDGIVSYVSQDASSPQETFAPFKVETSSFRVSVRLLNDSRSGRLHVSDLRSGMTLRADVVIDKRRIWQILIDPIIDFSRTENYAR
ncbi:HlyD family secretion protein [Xanthomonas campestris pv. paulliniae]|uniref:HlyD family secretion protein n=1 Tax=Xanthomonas euvesicatoria TaxID=456327 RepID=UPI001C487180|nr:HlyD family efflux transporter periplasmic adaptor subunit [Xanthomonas euvesicatoria]MBV6845781.1 HlyD family secretion protein [Xanthomonas campestris pv. paulliniae]